MEEGFVVLRLRINWVRVGGEQQLHGVQLDRSQNRKCTEGRVVKPIDINIRRLIDDKGAVVGKK